MTAQRHRRRRHISTPWLTCCDGTPSHCSLLCTGGKCRSSLHRHELIPAVAKHAEGNLEDIQVDLVGYFLCEFAH